MKNKKGLTNELKVIVVNPPTKEQAERKIKEISELLSTKGDYSEKK